MTYTQNGFIFDDDGRVLTVSMAGGEALPTGAYQQNGFTFDEDGKLIVLSDSAQSGSGAILPWTTATAYVVGQPVTNSGQTYTANDAHTSGATFAGDLASHWTALPVGVVTKRVTQPISGAGITSLTGADIGNDWVQRVLYAPPVTPTRYRFRAANYGAYGPDAGSGSVDGLGFWIGPPSLTGTGRWVGVGASAPTRVVASGFTIPNTINTPYVSDWITNTGLLEKGVPSVIGFAVSVPSGVTFRYDSSADLSWFGAGVGAQAGNAAAPTGGNGPYPNRALDVSIEYEFETTENGVPVVLCVGDSITQGATGGDGGAMPHEAWPGAAALRHGFADVNAGISGVTAASLASNLRFNRLDLATTVPDAAIVAIGTNDIIATSTDSDIITSIASIVSQLRTLGIQEIYLGTVIPGAFTSGKETARLALNNRLRSLPFGAAGCIDFAKALALQATPATADPDLLTDGAANPHPLRGGYQSMASIVPSFGRSAA